MAYQKKYAKGSGSHKAKGSEEVQTAFNIQHIGPTGKGLIGEGVNQIPLRHSLGWSAVGGILAGGLYNKMKKADKAAEKKPKKKPKKKTKKK
mgnify:CR=1 FL=1|tara:strand:- start:440 stop:715 length:276 start_codon:yes stop_codon:yes gene_type:complete